MPVSHQQHDKKRRNNNITFGTAFGNNQKKSRRGDRNNDNDQTSAAGPSQRHELPIDLWPSILSFLDVPDLGSCAKVSKELSAIAQKDTVWEHHLKKLLRTVFEGAIFLVPKQAMYLDPKIWTGHPHLPKPLLERPLTSTNFSLWYREWRELKFDEWKNPPCFTKIDGEEYRLHFKAAVGGSYQEEEPMDIRQSVRGGGFGRGNRWLAEDVPLRLYYREASRVAYSNYRQYRNEYRLRRTMDRDIWEEDSDRSESDERYGYVDSDDEDNENEGRLGYRDGDIFRGLPDIRVFHGWLL